MIMKKILFLSLLTSLITVTFEAQCMLRCLARPSNFRARCAVLQQRNCSTQFNEHIVRRIRSLETVIGVHAQQIKELTEEVNALKKCNKTSTTNPSLLPDYNAHHNTHPTSPASDSYLPEYNMHYGNKGHRPR